jgi:hypothetical protein
MQRIKSFRNGERLQIEDPSGIFSFDQTEENIWIGLRESVLDPSGKRVLDVNGKDNIAEFAAWFAALPKSESTAERGSFVHCNGQDRFKRHGAVSKQRIEAVDEEKDRLYAAADALIDVLGQVLDVVKPRRTEPDVMAIEHRLAIPTGYVTVLFAEQEQNRLRLLFDERGSSHSMPLINAQEFGEWAVSNTTTLEKRSIWG